MSDLIGVDISRLGPEYWLMGSAAVISITAYAALILSPAVASFGRGWERVAASFVSLFIFAALIALGVAVGVAIVYFWDDLARTL